MEKKNLNLKLNLSRFKNVFTHTFSGNQVSKKCVCIPIEDNYIVEGEKGYYISLLGMASDKLSDGATHLVKASIPKEKYKSLPESERMNMPILGDIRPFSSKGETQQPQGYGVPQQPQKQVTDLPF